MVEEKHWYTHHLDQDDVDMDGLYGLAMIWEEATEYTIMTKNQEGGSRQGVIPVEGEEVAELPSKEGDELRLRMADQL